MTRPLTKQAFCLMLCVAAALLVLCFDAPRTFAYAEDIHSEGYFQYVINGDEITITSYFGRESDVAIPERIAAKEVTCIRSGAFKGRSTVTHLTIPYTMKVVEDGALSGASSLTSITNCSPDVAGSLSGYAVTTQYPEYVVIDSATGQPTGEVASGGSGSISGGSSSAVGSSGDGGTTSRVITDANGNQIEVASGVEGEDAVEAGSAGSTSGTGAAAAAGDGSSSGASGGSGADGTKRDTASGFGAGSETAQNTESGAAPIVAGIVIVLVIGAAAAGYIFLKRGKKDGGKQ